MKAAYLYSGLPLLQSGAEDRYIVAISASRFRAALETKRFRGIVWASEPHFELMQILSPYADARHPHRLRRFFLTPDGNVVAELEKLDKLVYLGEYHRVIEFLTGGLRLSPVPDRNIPSSDVGGSWHGPVAGVVLRLSLGADDVTTIGRHPALSHYVPDAVLRQTTMRALCGAGVAPGQEFVVNEARCILTCRPARGWMLNGALESAVPWFPDWHPSDVVRGKLQRID